MDFTAAPEPTPTEEPSTRRLRVTPASQVKVRRQRWVWAQRIILGGLTLLAGREGLGKSTIACWLVAQVTRGTLDGEFHGTPRNVIYLHTEDARDTTIVPRLKAAGADTDRVLFIDMVTPTEHGDVESQVVFPSSVAEVAELAIERDVALIVLDAATSVIDSRLDGDKDRQMRQGLEAIARGIGERAGCGVLGLVHFGKRDSGDTGKLILGSIAWSQVARSVLAVARDEDDGTVVLSATKANLAPGDTASLRIRLVNASVDTDDGEVTSVGCAEIIGETDVDARELLAAAPADPEERTELDEARAWLEEYLTVEGKTLSKAVKAAARAADIAERTLHRARKSLGVVSAGEGYPRQSYWSLPGGRVMDSTSGASGATDAVRAPRLGTTGTTGPDLRVCEPPPGTTDPVVPTPVHGTTDGTTAPADSHGESA
ncbi:AAA family ATPase [Pseudonocardia sp. H11422]|uniref:AAA family ATPase n=1 Tax=Pseudonocardia sp. H11422 TaxID=2835866 RepID=UPI001BDBF6B9|nr:AAA family ATPase [Pseudonocardia sp. H11422]